MFIRKSNIYNFVITLSFIIVSSFNMAFAQVMEGQLLAQWSDSTLVGSSAYNNTYNEVWGLAVNGHEYAIIGSTDGTHFIDVTDTDAIFEAYRVVGGTRGSQIIHRDYHDNDGFLYAVADEGSNSTLQIIDIRSLPDSITVVYDSKEYIRRSHNIFIDDDQDIMYACISSGDNTPFAALRLFDITDPAAPVIIATYNSLEGVFISQVHDAYVKDNLAYLNNGPGGMMIVDFTDPLAPILLSHLTPSEYPDAGYNHSGYATEDGSHYYMADENHAADMKVIDVTNPMSPQVVGTFNADNSSAFSIPHNQLVHGHYLYVSYYYDGLQVYDISDPATPIRVMEYKTSNIANRNSYEGAWGVYPFLPSGNLLVSDMQEGLFVIKGMDEVLNAEDLKFYNSFTLYPNPASDVIQVKLEDPVDAEIQVSNAQGHILLTKDITSNSLELDVKYLPVGYYFMTLISGAKLASKPFVINH